MLKYLSIFLFLPIMAMATIFQAQPIERQIMESDGVLVGYYLKKKSIRLDDGTIATQMFFKMNSESGLNSEYFGLDEVIVHYPGGNYEGKNTKIDGVPMFIAGERVVLFIINKSFRYWGMNLGFGAYKVINYGKEEMLVNYIFPEHPQVGQVKMDYFKDSIKKIKGSSLKNVYSQSMPYNSPSLNRLPASNQLARKMASKENNVSESQPERIVEIFWLLLGLAVLGGTFRIVRQKI